MADEESGGPPVPDPMELRDLLSDLTDMKLSDKLAEIVDSCAGKDKKKSKGDSLCTLSKLRQNYSLLCSLPQAAEEAPGEAPRRLR